MTIQLRPLTLAAAVFGAAMLTACSSSPTTPTAPPSDSSPSTPPPASGSVALSSLSLSAESIPGGETVTGTVTLTGAAPSGGAAVTLSGGDPANVPAQVTVPSGSTSATFAVSTRVVGGTIPVTITASYGGASKSATLSVTRPIVATAIFGVSGPNQSDTCSMNDTATAITCIFNGSMSTAPATIVAWDWTFFIPGVGKTFAQTTAGPVLNMPAADCTLLPPPPMPAGSTWFNMAATLKVRDEAGNESPVAMNDHVRLFPDGRCGY